MERGRREGVLEEGCSGGGGGCEEGRWWAVALTIKKGVSIFPNERSHSFSCLGFRNLAFSYLPIVIKYF